MQSDALVSRIQNGLRDPLKGTPTAPLRVPDHELIRRIGGGSYGDVWLARSVTGRLRAVKVVWRQNFSCDRPYEREFRGIVQFEPISRSHPSVVNVLHVGRDDGAGCFFYVMELADNANHPSAESGARSAESALHNRDSLTSRLPSSLSPELAAIPHSSLCTPHSYHPRTLAADLRAQGRLPIAQVLELGVQLANALGHLHRHGLVHRDVKPSNVIFVGGQPKLADIGLVTGKDEARSFVGTEGFIPPEGPGTERADLFSLGRLVYEAATGKDRCEFPELPADLDTWPPERRTALLELNEVLVRACAPEPAQRQANSDEFAADLNLIRAGRSIRRLYGVERRLRQAAIVSIAALCIVVVALLSNWYLRREKQLSSARAREEATLRQQAEAAEALGRERLRESLRQEALALARSSDPDRRAQALAALRQAAEIRPGLDLRNAAATAFSTPELRVLRRWTVLPHAAYIDRFDARLERYVTIHPDGALSICAAANDRELVRLPSLSKSVQMAAFSPDGRWLMVRNTDRSFYLWNLRTQEPTRLLQQGAWFQAFSPDSRYLALSCTAPHLHLFEVATGKELWRVSVPHVLEPLSFHPREPLILGITQGQGQLQFYGSADGQVVRHAAVPKLGLAARWSHDGSRLITSHADFAVRVWNWPALDTPQLVLRFHRAEPVCLACDPSDRWLATAGWDDACGLFDLRDGRLLLNLRSSGVYPAADQPAFAFCNGKEWTLAEFDPAVGLETIPIHELHKSPRPLAFSPDGQWLATGGGDGVRLVRWQDRQVSSLDTNLDCIALMFSSDSRELYAFGDGEPKAWRRSTAPPTEQDPWLPEKLPPSLSAARAESAIGAFCADRRRWISLVQERNRRWGWRIGNLQNGQIEFSERITDGVESPDLSPDGRWLAWGNWQHADAFVVDLHSDGAPVRLPILGSTTASFSPNGRWLVVGGSHELRLIDAGTWRVRHSIPRDPPCQLPPMEAFTSDSRICAVVFSPGEVRLFETQAGTELVRLHPNARCLLFRPLFSPDDRFLVVASTDHQLLIWDLARLRSQLAALRLDWNL